MKIIKLYEEINDLKVKIENNFNKKSKEKIKAILKNKNKSKIQFKIGETCVKN